jgi:hypothetical protein
MSNRGEEGGEWDDFSESSHDKNSRDNSDHREDDDEEYERRHSRSFTPKKNYSDNYKGGNREGGYNRGGRGRGGYEGTYERRPPRNASKGRILEGLEDIQDAKSFWLNLFEVQRDINEDAILEFFAEIPCVRVEWHRNGKNSMDVEFETLDHLEAAIDMC